MERTYEGVVVRWTNNGYGFLYEDSLDRRIFFHACDWHRSSDPVVGDNVSFKLAPSPKPDKPEIAVDVRPINKAGA